MFDLEKAVPVAKPVDHDDYHYIDLLGKPHLTHAGAGENNMLVMLATISNNLERIANTQERMQKHGEEATKKADSTLAAAMGAFKGLGITGVGGM